MNDILRKDGCLAAISESPMKEGIKRQFTVANTPQQNGVAKRMNRTLLERTRAMLRDAGLEKSFWAEAVNSVCYLVNRAPSTEIELKTPMEMWTSKPVDYSNLHVFGSFVYVMYNAQEISKLDPKSRKCKFLGYADGVKGYRLWDPTTRKVIINRDVIFVEDKLQRKEDDDSAEKLETTEIHVENEVEQGDSSEAKPAHDEQEPGSSETPTTRQSDRVRRRPNWHSDYVIEDNIAYCLLTEDGEPSTYQEAIHSSDVSLWMMAMQEEIEALHKNNTWDLVPLPQGRKPIGNKWVFKIKRNGDDQVERCRARLVVKGYAQKECIDFNEIFSPVVRLTTVRVVLAMCATLDLHLEQLDVKTAFLHGNLEEEIYMLQPEGFEEKEKKNLVCRLNKSLYGLKHAPRCWYKRFDSFIMCLRYNRLNADPCAYFKRSGDNDFVILLLYVDDMLVAGPNKDHIEELKAQLAREFEMKDLGSTNKILGMQFTETESVVATSKIEAKYVAATQASKEAIWLKMLLEELGHNQEYVEEGTVDMQKIHTKDNIADFMTKAINADKFTWCRSSCGLSETVQTWKARKKLKEMKTLIHHHPHGNRTILLRRKRRMSKTVDGEAPKSEQSGSPGCSRLPPLGHRRSQSEVVAIGHRRDNSFLRLKTSMHKALRVGSNSKDGKFHSSFNPEVMANQKRQWYQLHSKTMEKLKYELPTSIFEHFVIVGIHPDTDLGLVEETFAERKKWEAYMKRSEMIDLKMLQNHGPPVLRKCYSLRCLLACTGTVKRQPGNLGGPSRISEISGSSRQFLVSAPRCYCLLTRVPFFELHYEMLNSINAQERLNRLTEVVSEINPSLDDNAPSDLKQYDQANDNTITDTPNSKYVNEWMASAMPANSKIGPPLSFESVTASEASESVLYIDDNILDQLSALGTVLPINRPARSLTSENNNDEDDDLLWNNEREYRDDLILKWLRSSYLHFLCCFRSIWFPPYDWFFQILAVVAGVLLEKQVVVVCPNLAVLSTVVLSLIPIIRSFEWQSLLLPVKTCYVPQLPKRKELVLELGPIHSKLSFEGSIAKKHPTYRCNEAQAEAATQFLIVMREYLESLCENLRTRTITNVQSDHDRVGTLPLFFQFPFYLKIVSSTLFQSQIDRLLRHIIVHCSINCQGMRMSANLNPHHQI
ncbi:hypothetical protein F3Y22_tig00110548pilonHSYRG00924 [Hibiscus syriacus]|uniref:Integrase catalytic domain-containing protein n=1 Tax=Hibiscus syriacus TaxID=106335 RepID=A0A6A3ABQ0_HIBSY|nr:hypothetical protein F3Y22_tig00110548pilonHSYRG00924 [Hibiscus syriacus]